MRVSLLTIVLITLYAAICSAIFVYKRLWFGGAVVAATAALFSLATVRAFNGQSRCILSFYITGWTWLVVWLGFYAETDVMTPAWITQLVVSITEPVRRSALDAGNGGRTMHSLHMSGMMMPYNFAPVGLNVMRVAVCITAILAAGFYSIVYHVTASLYVLTKKR